MRTRTFLFTVILFTGLVLLLTTSGSLVLAQTDDNVTGTVETDGDRLNMRFGPGVDYDLVQKLEPGTVIAVLDASADGLWLQVQPEDGDVVGWVSAEFVALDGPLDSISPLADATDLPSAQELLIPTATPIVKVTVVSVPAATAIPTVESDHAFANASETPDSEAPILDLGAEPSMTPTTVLTVVKPTVQSIATAVPTQVLVTPTIQAESGNAEPPSSLGQLFPRTYARALGLPTPTAVNIPGDEQEAQTGAATENAPVEKSTNIKPTPTVIANESDESEAVELGTAEQDAAEPEAEGAGSKIPPGRPYAITQPQSMNVRTGPGTNYGVAMAASAGSEFEIIGRSPGHTWLQVLAPGEDTPVWLYAELVEVVGSLDDAPTLTEDELPEPPTQSTEPSAVAASVAGAPSPTTGGSFGYGVQAHLLAGEAGAAMNSVSDLGFNWVKQQVEWSRYESSPGARGFGELAGIVSEAGNRNINVLFSVVNAPAWAREDGFDSSVGGPPADPQSYANFVGAMAGQFCGTSLKAIEIWNEQNLHYEWGNKSLNAADYMNLLRPAYASIKAACPQMLVISGALTPAADAGTLARDDFAYMEEMYKNGLASYCDGVGAHPSGYNVPADVRWESACTTIQQTGNIFNGACDTPHHSWSFLSTMEGYRNIMNVYGDSGKQIWPTEFGWAAGGAMNPNYMYAEDNSYDEQAAWTVQAYQAMKSWGWVGPAFLWNLNFRVVADGTEKAQWGIVRNDYSPLPVYDALKAMPK